MKKVTYNFNFQEIAIFIFGFFSLLDCFNLVKYVCVYIAFKIGWLFCWPCITIDNFLNRNWDVTDLVPSFRNGSKLSWHVIGSWKD